MIIKKVIQMIDTHAHLNTPDFEKDIEQVIKRAQEVGVKNIIVIGMDDTSNQLALKLAERHEMIYATIGLHPGYVDDHDTLAIESYLAHEKVVAIGECGLDFYWTDENKERQEAVFLFQIELAIKHNLPLVIHTRNSFERAYEMLTPYKGRVKGVFHCFSSDLTDVHKAIDLGFYIGIDGPITFKKNDVLVDIIKGMDLNYLLIETDSPYLAPMPFRGQRNEPSYVSYVARKIAEIKEIEIAEVIRITTENAKRLFTKLGGQ